MKEQQERFKTALQNVPAERLGVIVNEARGWSLVTSICYGLNDEAAHTGEIYLLKKLWKKAHS